MKVRVKSQLFVLALMFAAPVCYSSDVHLSPSNNNINDNINSKNLKSAKTISGKWQFFNVFFLFYSFKLFKLIF